LDTFRNVTQPTRAAALVLRDARVRSRADEPAVHDRIAFVDGVVAAVGPGVDAWLPGARIVDLGGRTVLPAFVESHTHFHRGAVLARFHLDFESLRPRAIADVLAAVAERAATAAPEAWIQGDSLSAGRLAEKRWPDRHELDRAGGGRPVVLRGIGKHVVAASSAALAAAGIDATTPDPPGGRIEREADGTPTGVLHERAKLRLDQSDPGTVVPAPSAAERRTALREAQRDLHRLGITTLHEMIRLPDEAADWAALHAAGELDVRVRLYYRIHESPIQLEWLQGLGLRRGFGDDRLRVQGVKVSVDGFCIFRNALVEEPYPGRPDDRGLLRVEPDRLDELVRRADAAGLQVAVHAVGVAAVDLALDAFERSGPAAAGPYRLEHGYVDMDAGRLARMRDLGVVWSTQPAFRPAYREEWLDAFGADRRARIMPLGTGREAGLTILGNSDFPCVPLDPLDGIRAATADPERGPAAVVDAATAWAAWTSVPADVAGDPHLGRLTPGAAADAIVLDEDPLAPGAALERCRVRATVMQGRAVWDEEGLLG
jgi:predicted amidohydrolase YtcJ